MSKAVELARLGSLINITLNSAFSGANTFDVDSVTSKRIIVTDNRSGNTEFDGGNTAYPAIELLAGNPTSTIQKYTPAIKFGSTDANFITQNPKYGAAIVAEATQNYTNDSTGGMALSFWTSPISPGTQTSLRERVTIESSGQITVNNNLALAWQNSGFSYSATSTTSKSGARLLKFTDNHLYIDNFDAGDIILRTSLASFNTALRIYGSNTNVEIFNDATINGTANINGTTSIDGDLYFNSGYGSAGIAYACRAWVNFNGVGTVSIFQDGGITSITDEGVGRYRLNFSSPFPDTRYVIAGAADGVSTVSYPSYVSHDFPNVKTVTSVIIVPRQLNGGVAQNPYDSPEIGCAIFR